MDISLVKNIVVICVVSIFWMACANISAPTGGERDTKSPSIRNKNYQDSMLNFKGGRFVFEFDEFVRLKDAQSQLVITPLLKSKPKLESHKRKVSLFIPDSLLEAQTTYQISFGEAIQDIHEGNPSEKISITFSTGSYFDSLSLKGSVLEAATGMVDTSSWVVLYDGNKPDSSFAKEQPMYIQKTSGGEFQFDNLPNRDFYIYALRDKNGNLKYDAGVEECAFYNKKVNPNDSTLRIKLFLFKEKNNKVDTSAPARFSNISKPIVSKISSLSYYVNVDTINKTKRTFNLFDTLHINFDTKIKSIDRSKIRLMQGEVIDATTKIELDTTNKKIHIIADWAEESTYMLQLTKGFAADSAGNSAPAKEFTFKTKRNSDYGNLLVKYEAKANQILSLFSGSTFIAKNKMSDTSTTFNRLIPGDYRLEILYDKNDNGLWDSGSWNDKLQPEIVERRNNIITIKANWENKIDLRSVDAPKRNLK